MKTQTPITHRIKRYANKKTLAKHFNRLVGNRMNYDLPLTKNGFALSMRYVGEFADKTDLHYHRVMAGLLDCWKGV